MINNYFRLSRLIALLILFIGSESFAQPGLGISFRFSSSAGVTAIPGGTPQLVPVANQDDFGYNFAPVGMNLKFGSKTYSRIIVSTNGWLALTNGATPASITGAGYLPTNLLSNNTTGLPIIAPYWDDLSTTLITYNYTAPVLWVQWTTRINKTNAAAANNFWVRIDGSTGVINFYYLNNPAYVLAGPPSASIGLAGECPGDYYSYNFPAAPTYADSTIETSNISTKPLNLTMVWTPYQAYDNCATAKDLGPLSSTCTPVMFTMNSAIATGPAASCGATGSNLPNTWLKVVKPMGVTGVTITTSPVVPMCGGAAIGTSIDVFSSCGGASQGCSTTSTANPGYGELTLARSPCIAETLYIRVTSDGAGEGGKFNICVKDNGTPPNPASTCGSPNWICTIPYAYGGSTSGFGADYDSANSVCHDPFMNGEDYVFAYTPPSNICLRVSINSASQNPGVFVFDGCPDQLLTTHCIASAVNNTGTATINSVSLIAGTTYYIVVDNNSIAGVNNIPFTINITSVGTSQPYNACGAVSLGNIPATQLCVYASYSTECATPSIINYPAPGCGNLTNSVTGDIWLSFTPTYTGNLLISTKPSATNPSSDIAMAVYTGNCTTLNPAVACDDNSAGNNMPSLSIPVTNGVVHYLRIWTVAPGNTGNFDLCFTGACSPPNDQPCAAVYLGLGGTIAGTNACAGSGGEPSPVAQCVAGGTVNTVWYKAVVPPSGSLKIRTHTRTLTDTQIESFRFPTGCANAASSLVRGTCNDDGPDCGTPDNQAYHDFSELILNGQLPGDTIFIAVDGMGSQTGIFNITIIDGNSTYPPIPGADCDGTYDVCGPLPIVVNDPGILGYGNICDFTTNYDCWLNGERNSAWYRFTVNPGTLQFDIQTFSDYDFIMWDITGVNNPCALISAHTLPSVRCNWVTTITGHTGLSIPDPTFDWEPALNVVGTRTFLLNINNWNPPFMVSGYTIDWMGSPISLATPSLTWQGVDTVFSNPANWGPPPCSGVPSCATDAVINPAPSGGNPTITANQTVKSVTINAGATLRIKSPFTLDVCGNFTNNGTLIAEPGSTVRFIGSANQVIAGNLTGANGFANLTINKAAGTGNVSLNTNIDVKQNFVTSTSTSIFSINGKYMKVAGNFTNASGTATFTGLGNSTVEFNGSGNQNFTNSAGIINLNDVKMNKTGGKLYLVGASSTMNIDSTLNLTSGIIVTRSLPALEVNMKWFQPAAILGPPNASSYIDGKLRRKISNGPFSSPVIPASYDFPVGDSTLVPAGGGYELANINFTSATLVTDLLATFNDWPTGAPNPGPVASECLIATYSNLPIFNNGYWTFTRTGTNVNGRYTVSLYNTGVTNNTGNGWTVAKTSLASNPSLAASWSLTGNCVITSTPANTQRANINPAPGVDSLSFNHHYVTAQTDLTLPVELLYFTAEPSGEDVICKWETASEINNDYFDVERSNDGKEFESIGRVPGFGIGVTSEKREYSLIDRDRCNDIRYYRLKQVDIDGETSYSHIAAVNCKNIAGIELYPNPANTVINYKFSFPENSELIETILDVSGRVVRMEKIGVVKGFNHVTRKIEDLAPGAYNLRITGKNNEILNMQVQFFKN